MPIQLTHTKKRCQQPSHLLWIVCASTALALVGCEPVTDFFPQLPGQDTPTHAPPTPQASVQSPATAKMEAAVRQGINEIREQKGLNALDNNEKL
ncbi:MAG TPA: hypothetical protein V6D50_08400, partial [Chroococcales cyanobacterium]